MDFTYLCLQPLSGHGASDAHVSGLIQGLDANGVRVRLFATRDGGRSLTGRLLTGAVLHLRAARALCRSDVVYLRMHPVAAIAAFFVRRATLIVEVNGIPEDFYTAHPKLRRVSGVLDRALKYQLRCAHHVAVVTDGLAQWLPTFEPGAPVPHLLPNAADPAVYRPGLPRPVDAPDRYVLFFGALSPWQGIDLMLGAVRDHRWPKDVRLLVIGGGPEAHRVERAAAAMPGRIMYLGSREASRVPAYVSNAIATLCPKRYHDSEIGQSPLKVYESLSAGVPVISTLLNGVTDVGSLSAAIVPVSQSPGDIARAVAGLYENPENAARMGEAGRRAIVDRHTWNHRASELLEVIRQSPN